MVERLNFSLVYSCAALLYRQTPASDHADMHTTLRQLSDHLSTNNHKLQHILENPLVSSPEKRDILCALFPHAKRLTDFLHLLIKEGLAAGIPAMITVFEKIYWDKAGFIPAKVTTAQAIDPDFKQEIDAFIAKETGKHPQTTYAIDPSLIAGAKIQMGYDLLDTTLKTQFSKLRQCMKGRST